MQLSSILSLFALHSLSVLAVPEPARVFDAAPVERTLKARAPVPEPARVFDAAPVERTLKARAPLPVPEPKGGKGGGGGGEEEEEQEEDDDDDQSSASGGGTANASGAGRSADLPLGLMGLVGAGVVVGGVLGW